MAGLDGPQELPGIAPSPGPNAVPSLDAMGGGQALQEVTGAQQQFVKTATDSVIQVKERADRLAALSVDSQAAQLEQTLMSDPENGALFKQGKDAFPLVTSVPAQFQKQSADWISGLANDEQRTQAQRLLNLRLGTMQHSLNIHVGEQIQKYHDAETSSYISNESQATLGAISSGDPNWQARLALGRQRIEAAVSDWGQAHGLSGELVQQPDGAFAPQQSEQLKGVIADHQSQLTVGVIGQLLSKSDPASARAVLAQAQAQNQILPSQVEAATKLINTADTLGQAQQQATQIMQDHGSSLQDALSAARSIKDPEVQSQTVNEVKTRFNENADAQSQQHAAVFSQAADYVENNVQRPAALWGSLSMQEREQLDNRVKQLREGAGIDPETSAANFYRLKNMASDPNTRDDFLRVPLKMYLGKMDEKYWNELVNTQSELRGNGKNGGSGTSDSALAGWRTNMGVVDDSLKAAKLDPYPVKGTQDEVNVSLFRQQVDQQVDQLKQRIGKEPGPDDVQKITDSMLMKVPIGKKDWWGNPDTKPAFEITIADVPQADRTAISAALAKKGLPLNDDNIAYWYRQRFAGKNGRR